MLADVLMYTYVEADKNIHALDSCAHITPVFIQKKGKTTCRRFNIIPHGCMFACYVQLRFLILHGDSIC